MPIYEFKCKCCHSHKEIFATTIDSLSESCCNQLMSRVFSFTAGAMMEERFDPAVGKYISSTKQLAEHGKRLSEESHLRTGLDSNYVIADYTDKKTMGVTDEGIHEQIVQNEKAGNYALAKKMEKLI